MKVDLSEIAHVCRNALVPAFPHLEVLEAAIEAMAIPDAEKNEILVDLGKVREAIRRVDTWVTAKVREDRDIWKGVEGATINASLDSLIPQITAWQAKTFPTATLSSCTTHLRREVDELVTDPKDGEEIADVFFLLLAVANQAGVNLVEEVAKKFEKNLKRKWKEPDAEGVVEHVKETFPGVMKVPGVCGGRACIEGTRIPIWALVQMSAELEWTDAEIFRAYPDLPPNALEIAMHYEASHHEEIASDIFENDHGPTNDLNDEPPATWDELAKAIADGSFDPKSVPNWCVHLDHHGGYVYLMGEGSEQMIARYLFMVSSTEELKDKIRAVYPGIDRILVGVG